MDKEIVFEVWGSYEQDEGATFAVFGTLTEAQQYRAERHRSDPLLMLHISEQDRFMQGDEAKTPHE